MKTIRQLLRQPGKTLAGVVLVALCVAILIVCVGQSVAAEKIDGQLDDLFLTIAMPTTKYNGTSRKLPRQAGDFLEALTTDYPDIVRAVSAPGLASAYIAQLKPDLYTNHASSFGWETGTDGVVSAMVTSPVGAPYSCAMLEVELEEVLGKTPAMAWDIGTQDQWLLDVLNYYSVNIRGTVLGVVGLQDGFQNPVGMNITLTLMVSDEQAWEALSLQMGGRYLVYGMDYFDMDWLASQTGSTTWEKNTVTLTVRNLQQLQGLPAEYTVPTLAPLSGTAGEFLLSEQGKPWRETLEKMAINQQAFPVLGVDNLGYIPEFALGTTRIVAGRDFTAEELRDGTKVCVLAESLAAANGIAIGETITLRYYDFDPASPVQEPLSSGRGIVNPSARFCTAATPFVNEGESYTVIGLYRSQNEWADPATNVYTFTPNTVLVPKNSVSATMDYGNQGLFRSYVLHNGQLEAFQQLAAQAGFANLFLCDDHGYAAVCAGLNDYHAVADRAMGIGLGLCALIAALFLLLFPLRQKKTLTVMATMGATWTNRLSYLLRYSLSLLLPGCALGVFTGFLLWTQAEKRWLDAAGPVFAVRLDGTVPVGCGLAVLLAVLTMALLLTVPHMGKNYFMDRK